MTTKELPKLMDIKQIAEHLGVTDRYIRRLVAERRIPFVKWGHYIRFNPAEVTKWIEEATVEVKNEASRWW